MSNTRIPVAAACLLGFVAILAVLFFFTPLLSPKKAAPPKEAENVTQNLAPAGTYYLLEPTSVPTSNGIYRITPGTELKLVAREGERLRLTDGQVEITLSESEVTDDLDVADLVRQNNAELQKRIAGIQIREHTEQGTTSNPEPTPRRTVPPGYYCMLRRVSQFTDSGVVAWPPGTKLALISRSKGNVRLTDGDMEMNVEESDVTDDLELAELVQQNYTELQGKIRAILLGHHAKKKLPLGKKSPLGSKH